MLKFQLVDYAAAEVVSVPASFEILSESYYSQEIVTYRRKGSVHVNAHIAVALMYDCLANWISLSTKASVI